MNKRSKRMLAWMTALCLIPGLCSPVALADDEAEEQAVEETKEEKKPEKKAEEKKEEKKEEKAEEKKEEKKEDKAEEKKEEKKEEKAEEKKEEPEEKKEEKKEEPQDKGENEKPEQKPEEKQEEKEPEQKGEEAPAEEEPEQKSEEPEDVPEDAPEEPSPETPQGEEQSEGEQGGKQPEGEAGEPAEEEETETPTEETPADEPVEGEEAEESLDELIDDLLDELIDEDALELEELEEPLLEGLPCLQGLIIHTGTQPKVSNTLLRNPEDEDLASDGCRVFDPEKTDYSLSAIYDTQSRLRFRAQAVKSVVKWADGGEEREKDISWTSGTSMFADCLSSGHNVFSLTASDGADAEAVYGFSIDVLPTLSDLSLGDIRLDRDFGPLAFEYAVTVPEALTAFDVHATPKDGSYTVLIDGVETGSADISDPEKGAVTVSVCTADGISTDYVISIERAKAEGTRFSVSPEGARVTVKDDRGKVVSPGEDGSYELLLESGSYSYTVSCYGYVTATGSVPREGGLIRVELRPNAENTREEVSSDWSSFRNRDTNMGITDVATPVDPETTGLLWNAKLGTGWAAAPSVQIIVDDALIVMGADSRLYKLDLETGDVLSSADMVGAPNWGYTPPTYADGLIFCPLADGTIQAFDAKTLESVWVYQDPDGGQSLSPITYSDGYVYTGFWNGEEQDASFVCVSVSDDGEAAKSSTWSLTHRGGFYWAGALIRGNTVIVASDDGSKGTGGTSTLYALDKRTGDVICAIPLIGMGDARSSIAYDEASGRVYFDTTEGYLCSAKLDAQTGMLSDLKSDGKNAKSTSTPVVYKGRVYYATGSGISTSGSTGSFVVADAETLETLYSVELKGYPQNSMLLSTAYEDSEGYLYFYSTYNSKPGGVSMIRVKADGSFDDAELIELYDAAGYEEYCIASIICSADGTLFYKNDSGYIFAIGTPTEEQAKRLSELRVQEAERLIDAIPKMITKSNKQAAKQAIDAAKSFCKSLTEEELAKVSNYAELAKAEKALEKQTAGGTTKSVSLVGGTSSGEDGTYRVSEAVNAVVATVDGLDEDDDEALIAAFRAYDALSDDEKLFVTNYESLKERLDAFGAHNHTDAATGITADGLDWNIRLILYAFEPEEAFVGGLSALFGENGSVTRLFYVTFKDVLTGEIYKPDDLFTLYLPAEAPEEGHSGVALMVGADGTLRFIKSDYDSGEGLHGEKLVTEKALSTGAQSFTTDEAACWYGTADIAGSWDDLFTDGFLTLDESFAQWLSWLGMTTDIVRSIAEAE